MRKAVSVISAMLLILIMAVLISWQVRASQENDRERVDMSRLKLVIGEEEVPVVWEENESTAALFEKAENHPVTVDMAMYGGFEQVGPLGFDLPASDEQTTTSPGDIVLYSGNQIVVFYGSNSWAYTRLGRINLDPQEMTDLLGGGDVTLDISVLGDADTQTYAVEDVILNSGYSMPVIGLGTWTLSDDEARESVYQALKTGMRLIDTARYYQCEKGVGEGLQRAIDEGIVSREEVFITSKIMPSDYDRAAQGIEASLSDLGVSYIDLMLIHQPGSCDEEVYRAMEEAVREGKVRSIGISNYYTPEAVDEVLSYAEILPAIIQNENHLYYQNRELQEYVKPYGIVIESWYPFGGRGHTQDHFGNETVMEIAGAHQKTPAQVILRWQVQSGYIAIPGSSNPDHIAENFNIFDFELSGEEMDRLDGLNRSERYENW